MRAAVAKLFRDMPPNPWMVLPLQTTLVAERANGCVGAANLSLPTYTRATAAHQTDFEGKLNLLPSGAARLQGARYVRNVINGPTEDFSNAAWTLINGGTGSAPTKTNNFGVAPDGTTTAARITATRGAGDTNADYSGVRIALIGTTGAGVAFRRSTFIKSNTGSSQVLNLQLNAASQAITVTTAWQRVVDTAASTNANFDVGSYGGTGTDANIDVLVWHPSTNDMTGVANQNPPEYVSVGVLSAPWHGAGVDGVKYFDRLNGNTVTDNVVTENVGALINSSEAACAGGVTAGVVDADGPLGFLSEGARTQYLGVTDAPATQTTASLGTGTYTLWVVGAGSATSSAGTATITGGGAATEGTPNVLTVTGAGTVTVTVAGALTRFQLEAGAFASSYILNAGAAGTAVTRNADSLYFVGAGNIFAAAGTVAIEWSTKGSGTLGIVGAQNVATGTANTVEIYTNIDATNAVFEVYSGALAYANIARGSLTAGALNKGAFTWAVNDARFAANGTAGTPDTSVTAPAAALDRIHVCSNRDGTLPLFGTTRFLKIYPSTLSASRMEAMTTP